MNTYKETLHMMGTKITLYFKGIDAKKVVTEASRILTNYESIFSANSENSSLLQLKNTAFKTPQKINPELYELIKIGKTHSLTQNSYLNISIGPLIKLWRIGFQEANVPAHERILEILNLLNAENIELNDNNETVFFLEEGMEIDLGAIAKGYICDKIMAFFKRNGAISAMIDIGGNVLVYGDSPSISDDWNIGIQNPFLPRGNLVASVRVKNQSVVTSGIYERVLENKDRKYHHIFDSKTGYPIENNVASLTIIASTSLECDIYTTKLFGLDIPTILTTVNTIDDMSAIIITKDGQLTHTSDLDGKMIYNT